MGNSRLAVCLFVKNGKNGNWIELGFPQSLSTCWMDGCTHHASNLRANYFLGSRVARLRRGHEVTAGRLVVRTTYGRVIWNCLTAGIMTKSTLYGRKVVLENWKLEIGRIDS
jgi:hypothetical protein